MTAAPDLLHGLAPGEVEHLLAGEHREPHRVLGVHPVPGGVVLRALCPDAARAECRLPDGSVRSMAEVQSGLFAIRLDGADPGPTTRYVFHFAAGASWERGDPYRFPPGLGELDLHLFNEGKHRRLWRHLGAHPAERDGVAGVQFAVWAPNARRVSVIGDFCRWDGRFFPMRLLGGSGVFELFLPGVSAGALYKFEILTAEGVLRVKTDPMAQAMEHPPETASRVTASTYAWGDEGWMAERRGWDHARRPMSIYEVHLGSWARGEGGRPLGYREIAPRLAAHARALGFTHLELLPIAEHPFGGSWGYQVTGYFAPTARFGGPDDFRFFVDHCHREGLGVILDWVPAHFPKDDFALRRFDGSALYEHDDPRLAEHPDWGTLIFNYGREEVRGFLIANALYWLDEFHIDGLRVDAVASMLYRDYSRGEGQWLPNPMGGRENLEAIAFLRAMNEAVLEDQPGCFTVAEESTSWPHVTRPAAEGGLGFTLKWNMGWMHDTLGYFQTDPFFRPYHQNDLTFAMIYEYSERFIMPLSHDEVVHLKGSLIGKMPGDPWQKFANLRLLYAYQFTRPGKQLLFMGSEIAPSEEWNHDHGLDWRLAEEPRRAGLLRYLADLGGLYRASPALWADDHVPEGFAWIDCADHKNAVVSYLRRGEGAHLVVVLNLTPLVHDDYRIGVPSGGAYRVLLSSDAETYGGSGVGHGVEAAVEDMPYHGQPRSIRLRLPPLGALVLAPVTHE